MEDKVEITGTTIVVPESVVSPITDSNNVRTSPTSFGKLNGKPVLYRDAKTVLTMDSAFSHKILCTGPVLNLGDACGYSCSYCYVEAAMRKLVHDKLGEHSHQAVVMRRRNALQVLKAQLAKNKEKAVPHVVYSSSLVDIAANMELMRETTDACNLILDETAWDIRLLTKSNLLPKLVELIPEKHHQRLILGVSTGTFDDELGKVIEKGTALVSKRIESLHTLQNAGFRTFAMVCPSLPQNDYDAFAQQAADLLRYDRCEHVWAEVINVRGASFAQTIAALDAAGMIEERNQLALVCGDADGAQDRWEAYARATWEAHAKIVPPEKLRFLQYVERKENVDYWAAQKVRGAVLLGRYGVIKKSKRKKTILTVDGSAAIRELLEINKGIEVRLKRKALSMIGTWVENAIKIGEFFQNQKKARGHGQYLTWLVSNFAINRKTASNYVAVYVQRDRVLEAARWGIISHLGAAYQLAHKATRLEKKAAEANRKIVEVDAVVATPQLLLMEHNPVVADKLEEASTEPEGTETSAPERTTIIPKPVVLVLEGNEELIAELLRIAKSRDGRFQIIREDGQIRLNDYFSQKLALKAA